MRLFLFVAFFSKVVYQTGIENLENNEYYKLALSSEFKISIQATKNHKPGTTSACHLEKNKKKVPEKLKLKCFVFKQRKRIHNIASYQ